jgi:hypothetical protein
VVHQWPQRPGNHWGLVGKLGVIGYIAKGIFFSAFYRAQKPEKPAFA